MNWGVKIQNNDNDWATENPEKRNGWQKRQNEGEGGREGGREKEREIEWVEWRGGVESGDRSQVKWTMDVISN